MDVKSFKKQIGKGSISERYLFYGPENYLKKEYVQKLRDIVVTSGTGDFNDIYFEGAVDIEKVRNACDTAPVFSQKKIVVWENSGLFKRGSKGNAEKFSEMIGQIPDYTCFVLYEEEVDKRLKPYSLMKKNAEIVHFDYQKHNDLVKWIGMTVSKSEKSIDKSTAAALVDYVGIDMNLIVNELDKLMLYTQKKQKITKKDINLVCIKNLESKIFDLIDAAVTRNTKKALQLLDDMLSLREPIPKILYLVARQLRQIYQVKAILEKGTVSEASKSMGLSEYVIRKISRQASEFDMKEIKELNSLCLDMDVALKTGNIEGRMAVELIIAELSKSA